MLPPISSNITPAACIRSADSENPKIFITIIFISAGLSGP
jgi:hypothetical protein